MGVVPDSRYNTKVPFLLCTNVLNHLIEACQIQHGPRFLQTACQQSCWYLTFRCLSIREKQLIRNHHRLAIVKSAETRGITIEPNQQTTVKGYLDKDLPYQSCCALLKPCRDADTADPGLDIAPGLIGYRYKTNSMVEVSISNLSPRTMTVSSNAILCEVQPVTIEDYEKNAELPSFSPTLSQIDLN